jgi:hypothetical protein
VLDWARERRIGFSCFVSLGDGTDVDFGDLPGDPVALEILSPEISHKSDVVGVTLDLDGEAALRLAGFTVQAMARRPHAIEAVRAGCRQSWAWRSATTCACMAGAQARLCDGGRRRRHGRDAACAECAAGCLMVTRASAYTPR